MIKTISPSLEINFFAERSFDEMESKEWVTISVLTEGFTHEIEVISIYRLTQELADATAQNRPWFYDDSLIVFETLNFANISRWSGEAQNSGFFRRLRERVTFRKIADTD